MMKLSGLDTLGIPVDEVVKVARRTERTGRRKGLYRTLVPE